MLEYGKEYFWLVQTKAKGLSKPFDSELRSLQVDIRQPSPIAPKGDIDGDPMPVFQWSKPQIEDCRFEGR